MTHHAPLPTSWQIDDIARMRDTYYAASQRKFVPFADPMVFRKGSMQFLWDAEGRKYIDLPGMTGLYISPIPVLRRSTWR